MAKIAVAIAENRALLLRINNILNGGGYSVADMIQIRAAKKDAEGSLNHLLKVVRYCGNSK